MLDTKSEATAARLEVVTASEAFREPFQPTSEALVPDTTRPESAPQDLGRHIVHQFPPQPDSVSSLLHRANAEQPVEQTIDPRIANEQAQHITHNLIDIMRAPRFNQRGNYLAQERKLVKEESKIGATLLGEIPAGHSRDFFCLDRSTWVWHEEWVDKDSKNTKIMNVHYEFQPRGVLKIADGIARGFVKGQELSRLLDVMRTYHDRVAVEVYGCNPASAAA